MYKTLDFYSRLENLIESYSILKQKNLKCTLVINTIFLDILRSNLD